MAALENTIYIGSVETPDFEFVNADVDATSIDYEESVDLIESELAIDVLNFIVKYTGNDVAGLVGIAYGTPVFHYVGSTLMHKFYIKQVQRIGKDRYKISTTSPIGLLNKQYHKGGVYTGVLFSTLIADLIGNAVPYTYDTDVGETKVYGWLPYDTKRKNLHQVMFAENISIIKNANGDMHFTYVRPSSTVPAIPQSRIFVGGTIKYPAIATSVRLTEHSYQNVDTIEPVVLVDNSDKSPATNKLFVFEQAPIVVTSITASGDLTIVERGVNYAILSGQGVLTGRPYYDKQSTVEKNYNSGGESYTVSVDDATLVTGVNSENVADRLLSYYTSSEIVNADLKVDGEKCGRIYEFIDMFGNTVQAFLTKMRSKISSLIKASCEFVSGYVPSTFGNNYTHWGYVTGNTGTIEIQAGTKIARFVIIGGGSGGSSGLKGIDNLEDLQAGGIGGEGGFGGNGGKIREVVLHNPQAGIYQCSVGNGGTGGGRCSDTQTRNQGTGGSDSTVTTPSGTVYSTADSAAYYSRNGIKNLFTEDVYAIKGRDGCKGGNGGRGTVAGNGESGEDVLWDGVLYHGGTGGKGLKFDFANVKQSVTNGGAGGWGAQPYMDGANGGSVTVDEYHDMTSSYASTYKAYEYGKFGQAVPFEDGNPHTVNPSSVVQIQEYGEGGDGGHGGAGRGGFGSANDYYQSATDTASPSASNKKVYLDMSVNPWNYTLFNSSDGGAGNNGRKGIILCYADKEVFF